MAVFQKFFLGCLCFLLGFSTLTVQAQDGAFTDFRIGVIALKSGGSTDPLSIDMHWTPRLTHEDLTVRADIGLSFVDPTGNDQFALFGYELFVERVIEDNMSVELGAGYQNFLEHGGMVPVVSGHIIWSQAKDVKLLKGFYTGVSRSFGDQPSWQGRAGLILNLD